MRNQEWTRGRVRDMIREESMVGMAGVEKTPAWGVCTEEFIVAGENVMIQVGGAGWQRASGLEWGVRALTSFHLSKSCQAGKAATGAVLQMWQLKHTGPSDVFVVIVSVYQRARPRHICALCVSFLVPYLQGLLLKEMGKLQLYF
jgi:hypothetical protein